MMTEERYADSRKDSPNDCPVDSEELELKYRWLKAGVFDGF